MARSRGVRLTLVLGALLFLSACASHRVATAPARPAPVSPPTMPAPPTTPAVGYEEAGEASWYGNPHHGRRTASGEIYDMNQMTAAHRTLPFGTRVRVESLLDGSSVEVRINDRGPFKDEDKRIIDLSYAAARLLGAIGPGVIPIRLRVVAMPSAPTAVKPPPPTAAAPVAAP
ncbi:MAG TPA: septal ring lytic transglycosylase RlpA family protein, partial [Methylomirabilota bacterium]|nr:septal ring lytic transglycosylase RlpA family protein [Methylomirabilota bacterium]